MPHSKGNFGSSAHELAQENGMTVPEVAAKIKGMPAPTLVSQFTKWKSGRWHSIPERKLIAVVEAITRDKEEQAKLVWAYLVDMTPAKFRPAVADLLEAERAGGSVGLMAGGFTPDLQRKLEAIGNAYQKSDDLRRMVDTVAGWARRINSGKE